MSNLEYLERLKSYYKQGIYLGSVDDDEEILESDLETRSRNVHEDSQDPACTQQHHHSHCCFHLPLREGAGVRITIAIVNIVILVTIVTS